MTDAGMPSSGMSDQPSPPPMPSAPPPPMPSAPPPPESWQAPPAAPVPGAAGFVYADVPNRVIALIIDAIILAIINIVVGIILGIVGLGAGLYSARLDLGLFLVAIVAFLIDVGYFMYMWTQQRATIGMRALGMQVGNAFDGKTLTTNQAIRRAIAVWGPSLVAQFFGGVPAIGGLLSLLALIWVIYLLYSTATSPTKQGFHDIYANSVVVKATRVA